MAEDNAFDSVAAHISDNSSLANLPAEEAEYIRKALKIAQETKIEFEG